MVFTVHFVYYKTLCFLKYLNTVISAAQIAWGTSPSSLDETKLTGQVAHVACFQPAKDLLWKLWAFTPPMLVPHLIIINRSASESQTAWDLQG